MTSNTPPISPEAHLDNNHNCQTALALVAAYSWNLPFWWRRLGWR